MAPQYGNRFGTCSIEILTPFNVKSKEWQDFMQEIVNAWTSYKDNSGTPLNVRPHWSKQWEGLEILGMPINTYLKECAYRHRLPEFKAQLSNIAECRGYTLEDALRVYRPAAIHMLFGDEL